MIPSCLVAFSAILFFRKDTYKDYVIICYFMMRSASIVLNLGAIAVIFIKISLMHSSPSQKILQQSTPDPPEQVTSSSGHSHSSVFASRMSRNSSHDRVYSTTSALRENTSGEKDHPRAQQSTQENVTVARTASSATPTPLPPSPPPSPPPSVPHLHSQANPVFLLSKRLVYYCIVQTVTRIASSWYQLAYGFGDGELTLQL